MAISSPGIGSNLDVNSILNQLLAVEAQPLAALNKKEVSYQAKLSAYGNLKGVLSTFQTAVNALNNPSKFQAFSATSSESTVLKASASDQAAAGSYNINVSQLAQAQTIMSAGQSSTTATIGSGAATTLTFQFGTVTGGTFESVGGIFGPAVTSGGIPANSLTLNGTAIATNASTNSAQALAAQINLQTATTGVTATASPTDTGTLGAFTTTSGAATYSLSVAGVSIINNSPIGTTGATIDSAIAAASTNLAAAGVAFSGRAVDGTLKFTRSDGSNIAIQESGTGAAGGFAASVGIGKTKTFASAVSLNAAGTITIGGSNPTLAGFASGALPNTYKGASFAQDSSQSTGTVTIDNTNNTLQGIRDAINKAKIGVTASIVSDGSAAPNRLVLTSSKSGLASSMKISVTGDSAVNDLLAYDAAGTQKMKQTTIAQSTLLSVNGIAVNSATNTVTEAIQGVTLNVTKTGSTTLSVARDSGSITSGVNGLIKAYNDLDKTLKELTSYNAQSKTGGTLLGDATARSIQAGVRQMLSGSVAESSKFRTLSDIGVAFQKDGTLTLASAAKLQDAINNNINEVGSLFAAYGSATDSLISVSSSATTAKPGKYAVNVTTAATQGKTVGSAGAGLTITAGLNDQLALTIDGVSTSATITSGTYDIQSLASHLQSVINGIPSLASGGIAVKVTANAANILTIESNRYGSASEVVLGGNAVSNLLGTPTSSKGADVAGTIGGIPATGSGQTLTAVGPADGLKILVNGSATGDRGTVNFSQGFAFQLDQLVSGLLKDEGPIDGRTKGIDSSIKDISRQRDVINERLAKTEKRLRAQFTALDKVIAGMTQTSSFLSQQLSNLPK